MKSPFYACGAVILALVCSSCLSGTQYGVPGAGYTANDSYQRGYQDGSSDRARGRAHNPHINESSSDLPSAFRKEYIWGYTEGYRGIRGGLHGSK
ncbi:MAG: hypothetical protein RLZ97_2034 [Verrucomicrobiota bacterium]|jgi:hypothetical protein